MRQWRRGNGVWEPSGSVLSCANKMFLTAWLCWQSPPFGSPVHLQISISLSLSLSYRPPFWIPPSPASAFLWILLLGWCLPRRRPRGLARLNIYIYRERERHTYTHMYVYSLFLMPRCICCSLLLCGAFSITRSTTVCIMLAFDR